MIIGYDLMVQLGLSINFRLKVLQWGGVTEPMKEPRGLLGKSDLTCREMHNVVMHIAKQAFTREATERKEKILDINYAKVELKHITNNATHLKAEERTQLLRLLEDFKDLFDFTLGDWGTELVDLELKPDYKPFNSKYYPVPIINKEAFRKELKHLVKI